MYKVVYVLVDNYKLKFTNELMISLVSLKNKMEEIKITVITDEDTYKILENKKHPIFQFADIKCIQVSNEYNQKEKSRFLKTSLRRYIDGDFLFIDTDTVVCSALPKKISDADIAMVLDYNCLISNRLDREGVTALNRLCGIQFEDVEIYYNSGVIWVKDNANAREFYEEWHNCWKETLKKGFTFDQPAINYVARSKNGIVKELPSIWNVQVSVQPTPINSFSDAIIIHYFNIKESPYLLCNDSIKAKRYDDPEIKRIISCPQMAFDRCILLKLDTVEEEFFMSKSYKLMRTIFKKCHGLFSFFENIITFLAKVLKLLKGNKK